MNYADYKKFDMLNGKGLRHSLFVSGCTHYCKDCFNKDAWNFNYGKDFTEEKLDEIINDLNNPVVAIRGLSILGGEPLHTNNVNNIGHIIKRVRQEAVLSDIWIWSGYTLEQLLERVDSDTTYILNNIDVLVDGKFMSDLKDLRLKFRGSSNQRLINMRETMKTGEITLIE